MTNPKGTWLETTLVNKLRRRGIVNAERIPRSGSKDQGDVVFWLRDVPYVVECKNYKRFSLSEIDRFLEQARVEADNWSQAHQNITPFYCTAVKLNGTSLILLTFPDKSSFILEHWLERVLDEEA